MARLINTWFKLTILDNIVIIRVRLFDENPSQPSLNDNDTTRSLNEFLEKCNYILYTVSLAADF